MVLRRNGFNTRCPVFEYRKLFWISEPDGVCKNGCKRSGAPSEKQAEHEFSSCCCWSIKLHQDSLAILDISTNGNFPKWPFEPEKAILSVLS